MSSEERETLAALLRAWHFLLDGLGEARDLMQPTPPSYEEFGHFDVVKRTAARAFLKAFEQLQDVTVKLIRAVLILEDEDLGGLSARAIADRAESIGLIGDADRWSALVRLRNRLVHEYPLSRQQQFDRLSEVWDAHVRLILVGGSIHEFLRDNDYPEAGEDD